MDDSVLFIFFILVVIIVIAGFAFSRKATVRRKLRNAHVIKTGDFKDGDIAKIVGNIEFVDQPLIAPLSDRPCSYFHVHVEKKVSSNNSSYWTTVIEEERSCKFLIKDGDNYAYMNDSYIKSHIEKDATYNSGFLNDASEQLEKYLNSKGHKSEGFLGMNKTMRYKEGALEQNEEVAIYGKGKWKEATKLGLPERYGIVLEISSNGNEPVYLSDDPETTNIKIKEAQKVKVEKAHKINSTKPQEEKKLKREPRTGRYRK